MTPMRVLVIGWFSFPGMGATAGDYMAADVACGWMRRRGFEPVIAAHVPSRPDHTATASVEPSEWDMLVFVCGPIGNGPPLNTFLDRFRHARKFALNVSLIQDRADWNPFVHIVERDSTVKTNPDLTFASPDLVVPVVGLIYVGPQTEYLAERHRDAERAFESVLRDRDIAVIPIDTQLGPNAGGLVTAGQIESLIAKMDAVLTTRLHGACLAIRRGVPPVVIDSIPGGTKLLRQMRRIGWPLAFDVNDVDGARVSDALDFALTAPAREAARRCADHAREDLEAVEREFLDSLGTRSPFPGPVAP